MLSERINENLKVKCYEKEVIDFPKKNLMIEVTNSCNNKCIFCYNHCMKRKRKFIDEKLCKRILLEAYKLGSREVGFYVTGEPLLDNRLSKFIKYAKDIGYSYIYLTTNGILANLEKVQNLYDSGLNSIKYSINAINQEDYLFVHKTDNFNKIIDNLINVYEWKKKNKINIKVYVSYIATKYTFDYKKIINFFENKCDEIVVMSAVNQGGLIPNISNLLSSDIKCDINNNFKLPCNYPFNSVIVTVEGYLTACCMDFENMLAYADLNKMSLKDSWNNSIITKFRKRQIQGDVKNTICQNCVFNSLEMPEPLRKDLCSIKKEQVIFCNHLKGYLEDNKNGSN